MDRQGTGTEHVADVGSSLRSGRIRTPALDPLPPCRRPPHRLQRLHVSEDDPSTPDSTAARRGVRRGAPYVQLRRSSARQLLPADGGRSAEAWQTRDALIGWAARPSTPYGGSTATGRPSPTP